MSAERRIAVITGASTGIGRAAAHALAAQGFELVLVSRDPQRAEAARAAIAAVASAPVAVQLADLAVMAEVKRLAGELGRLPHVDVLINCAGAFYGTRRETSEGHELTWALNHLAPFALTLRLFEQLAVRSGRVLNLCTRFYEQGVIDFDDLESRRRYRALKVYATAKLANLVFTRELARRAPKGGVHVCAVLPGDVHTNVIQNSGIALRAAYKVIASLLFLTPEQGADTVVWAATATGVPTGSLLYRRAVQPPSALSGDEQLAKRVWESAEQQTGVSSTWR